MLQTTWFILWGVLWTVYFVLDGYDLGLGMLLPFLAKSDEDKRVVFNAMGPFWDGNEVWLLTAGGVTFAAFPRTYATMFSVLYTPLMLLLFALILRGISFEFRSKDENPAWRATWDACLTVGSFLPALLLGVAFANIFRGLVFVRNGAALESDSLFDLLNPYGLLGGVTFVLLFAVHGALWLAIRTTGPLQERGARMARLLWPFGLVAAAALLAASWFATPLWQNYLAHPALFVLPLLAVAGLVLSRVFIARRAWWGAWAMSALGIAGATLWGVAGLFPRLFWSRRDPDPLSTLTAFNSSSSPLTLSIMLGVALVMVPVIIGYQAWVHVKFSGKVRPEDFGHENAY